MLARLVAFALSQRLFVALSVLLLIGAGIVVLPSLPIDAFPDVSPVQVKIIMKAPGLTPEEVEQRITVPIELELLGLPNKKILRSTTKYALADITIDFEDGTDIYWARNQVSERLSNIARDLPEGVTGGLAPITSPLGEMFMFTIDSPDLSLAERRTSARLGDPAGVADCSGSRRCQLAWRSCPGLRDRADQRCPRGTRHFV